MDKQLTKDARGAELMVEDILGLYLSRDPLRDFNEKPRDDEPKLAALNP
jgi:hypothetical protein